VKSPFGYIILWLLGVPLSTLLLIWLISTLIVR
jgi:hypothetical protein